MDNGKYFPTSFPASFPTELLVYIFSFLHAVHDKVTLFYVSKRIRSVIEVPSLWREPFMWSYYESGEELCISNLLKACGRYVKTLITQLRYRILYEIVTTC